MPETQYRELQYQFTPTFFTGRGDWGDFWNKLQTNLDKIGGWQAKFLLQYIFGNKMILGRQLKMSAPFKGVVGKLTLKASGERGGMPEGWRGLSQLMFQKDGMWNPYGTRLGLLNAVMSGNIYSPALGRGRQPQGAFMVRGVPGKDQKMMSVNPNHPVRQFMREWNLSTPAQLDAFVPIYQGMWEEEHQENVRKAQRERRRGSGGGAEALLMGLAGPLTGMALGGTLFAGGAELAGAGAGKLLSGVGDVAQSVGAEMFKGGAGYYPKYSGMGLDPKRYDPGNIQRWEGPRTDIGRAITGYRSPLQQMPMYDSEEEEKKRLEELMTPYQWDEEPWRFRSSPYWGQSYWGQR